MTQPDKTNVRKAVLTLLDAIAALGARSPGTPHTYFDEHPMTDEGATRWAALDTAGKAVRAALAASPEGNEALSFPTGQIVLVPRTATRTMVDAADACIDVYSAWSAMVEAGYVR